MIQTFINNGLMAIVLAMLTVMLALAVVLHTPYVGIMVALFFAGGLLGICNREKR